MIQHRNERQQGRGSTLGATGVVTDSALLVELWCGFVILGGLGNRFFVRMLVVPEVGLALALVKPAIRRSRCKRKLHGQ